MINLWSTQVLRHCLLHTTHFEILKKITLTAKLYSKAGLHYMKHSKLLILGLLTFNFRINVNNELEWMCKEVVMAYL
jgi:hypothetical protein